MGERSRSALGASLATPPRLPRVPRGSAVRRIGALIGFVLLWYLVTITGLVAEQIIPPPSAVLATFVEFTLDWSDFALRNLQFQLVLSAGASIARVAVGLVNGILLGVTIGCVVAWYPLWAFPADLAIRTLRTIPGLGWVPLAVSWFGVSFLGPVFIVTLATVFPVAIATIHGVRTANPVYINSLRTLGADDRAIIREVVLPGAVPSILTGIRVGLNIGWWTVIAAEMFGAPGGLGFLVKFHGELTRMPGVMAGMVMIGLVSFGLDQVYLVVQRRLLAWQGPREGLERSGG